MADPLLPISRVILQAADGTKYYSLPWDGTASLTLTAASGVLSAQHAGAVYAFAPSDPAAMPPVIVTPPPATWAGEPPPAIEPVNELDLLPVEPLVQRASALSDPWQGTIGSEVIDANTAGGVYSRGRAGGTMDRSVKTLLPGAALASWHFGSGFGGQDIMVRARQRGAVVWGDMDPVFGKALLHAQAVRLTVIRLAFHGFSIGNRPSQSNGTGAIYAEQGPGEKTWLDVRECDFNGIGGDGIFTQPIEALSVTDSSFSVIEGNGRFDQMSHDIYNSARLARVERCIAGGLSLGNNWKFRDNDLAEVINCFVAMRANFLNNPRFLDFCANQAVVNVIQTTMVMYPDVVSRAVVGGTEGRGILGFGEESPITCRPMAATITTSVLYLCGPGMFISIGPHVTLDLTGLKCMALRGSGVDGLLVLPAWGPAAADPSLFTVVGPGWEKRADGSYFLDVAHFEIIDALPVMPTTIAA